MPTEASSSIIEGMLFLGFGKKGSVLLSDNGPCFPLVAEHFEMHPRLCAWHFMLPAMKSTAGMPADDRHAYLREINWLVYDDLQSAHDSEVAWNGCDKYGQYQKA